MSYFESNIFNDDLYQSSNAEFFDRYDYKNYSFFPNNEIDPFINEFSQQFISIEDIPHNNPENKGNQLEEGQFFNQINPNQNDEDSTLIKIKDLEKLNKNEKKIVSSTAQTSEKKNEIRIQKVDKFKAKNQSLPNYWRFDMVKKHFKSRIIEFGYDWINKMIQKSDLPEELKKKIHKPNSLLFTANVKVTDNYNFLKDNLRKIFTIGKEKENLQKQNEYNIMKIFEYFEKVRNNTLSDNLREIKVFFEMNYEDLIRKFYLSDKFTEFKEDSITKFYDEGTIKQEGFSLLKDFGIIKLFMMLKKKRKRDINMC